MHEKRAPEGTRCTEGFVTVERLLKHGVLIVVWVYYSIKKISYYRLFYTSYVLPYSMSVWYTTNSLGCSFTSTGAPNTTE